MNDSKQSVSFEVSIEFTCERNIKLIFIRIL